MAILMEQKPITISFLAVMVFVHNSQFFCVTKQPIRTFLPLRHTVLQLAHFIPNIRITMIACTYQDFAPRELYVPANPNVGALAAQSETLFQTNTLPIDRTKRKEQKKRRQSRFFDRAQIRNNDYRRVAAIDQAVTKRDEVPKVIRFPSVTFCRGTNRKNYSQRTKLESGPKQNNTIKKHPSAIQDPPGKSAPSHVQPRFSTTAASRFRFVSFRRGTNRKTNRRARIKGSILSKSGRKRTSASQESEAAKIMAGIISGERASENSTNKNGMCRPYKYCYCEHCFDSDLDWEFQECSELDRSGRHNHVWERRDYSPKSRKKN